MKKIFVLSVLLSFLFSSCGNSSDAKTDGLSSYSNELLKSDAEVLARVSNKDYNELITKKYSEKNIFDNILVTPFLDRLPLGDYVMTTTHTVEEFGFPVECIRKPDNANIYAVYKTEEGGVAYLFFEKQHDLKDVLSLTYSIYMKNNLVKSDFDNIKIGDSIEMVCQVDSSIRLLADKQKSQYGYTTFSTVHLLKNGVIIIYYEKQNEDHIVKSIDFFPDFIVTDKYTNKIYNCRILSQDYPH
jgi:hypothetical protein